MRHHTTRKFLSFCILLVLFFSTILLFSSVKADGKDGIVYWSTGFETGNYNDLTIGKGGTPQTEGTGSSYHITSSIVYNGNYAFIASVDSPPGSGDTSAKAIRWSPMDGTQNGKDGITSFYFGAALYLSPGFTSAGWGVNIMQLHVMSDSGVPLPAVLMVQGAGETLHFQLYSKDWNNTEHVWWDGGNGAVPTGKWFTAVIYWDGSSANGNITLWINNVKMATESGDFRVSSNGVDPDGWSGPFVDAGIYQSHRCPAQYVVVDDMCVASTLSLATPASPEPTPIPNPTLTSTASPTKQPGPISFPSIASTAPPPSNKLAPTPTATDSATLSSSSGTPITLEFPSGIIITVILALATATTFASLQKNKHRTK